MNENEYLLYKHELIESFMAWCYHLFILNSDTSETKRISKTFEFKFFE